MDYGIAHVAGNYTYPNGSGTQFTDGCDQIWNLGIRNLKVYLSASYLTDYPLQASWSSTPVNLTQLAQTTQFSTQMARAWKTITFTTFTFANGITDWWKVDITNAKLAAEYTEMYNLTTFLLSTYNNTGKTFILQNWEGDHALGSTIYTSLTPRQYVDYYAAFLNVRQKAVSDARKASSYTNVKVLHAVECNRVLDSQTNPDRRRIITDLASRIDPDIISYSSYDSTIATRSWLSGTTEYLFYLNIDFPHALSLIKQAFPGKPLMIGEYGFGDIDGAMNHPANDINLMHKGVRDIAVANGVFLYFYWQIFDNDGRGFYAIKADGTRSVSGQTFADFAAGL